MNTHILCSIPFFRKSHRLFDNAEKYTGDRGAINITIWRTRSACWISKTVCACTRPRVQVTTHTHARSSMYTQSNIQYLLPFHNNNGFVKSTRCYYKRTRSCFVNFQCTGQTISVGTAVILWLSCALNSTNAPFDGQHNCSVSTPSVLRNKDASKSHAEY